MDSPEVEGRRERRVRQMLKSFYGANGKSEANEDPTSVDSMAFDIDQYFNQVLRGKDLAAIQAIFKQFEQETIDINGAMKVLVVENYTKFLGVSDTMKEINKNMGGIVAEMEKLNSQVDTIVSDSAYLSTRFARTQGESARLTMMQELIRKLQYISSIPDRLREAIDMADYAEAAKYFQLCNRVLTKYLHIPSFKIVYDDCCECIVLESQNLKEKLIDPKLSERESADIVRVLLDFGSSPEQLRALFLYGRTAAIEFNWYAEEKSSTIPGDPLASLRECNRTFFTHLLMSSFHFKNLFAPPEPEVLPEESPEPTRRLSASSSSPEASRSPSWKRSSKRLSNKSTDSPPLRESSPDTGRDSPVPVSQRPDSPRTRQVETHMEDWDKFVLEHFVKYLHRVKTRIMGNDNITQKLLTMQALSIDISQVHRQMPELPIQAVDDFSTDVINDHISKSFATLQESVIENFKILQSTISDVRSLEDANTAFQEDLEKNTHFVISHLQSVMNTLTEMFSSTETKIFRDNYQMWVTKVQIKLQQFLLTILTVCSEMCDWDTWPKHIKPSFLLSVVHLCIFFKKRGLAQIQKTLDNIISNIEKKDINSDEDEDTSVSFTQIIAELRKRCKETAEELILIYISAHCRVLERMLKKLLETSNWIKAKEPREVKLGTALIVDEFFKIFVEVSTLFSSLPAPKFTKRTPVTSSSEIRYSATLSPNLRPQRMIRAPSLPTLSNLDTLPSKLEVRHARTNSALPRMIQIAPLSNSGTLPSGPTSLSPPRLAPPANTGMPRSSSGIIHSSNSGMSRSSSGNIHPSNSAIPRSNSGTIAPSKPGLPLSDSGLPRSPSSLYLPTPEEEVAVSFVPDLFKCSAPYILFRLVQFIFKSYLERVRTKTMSRGGCQQVEVDTEYMKLAFMKVIPDSRIEGFAKTVQSEAATRAADPQSLQKQIILQLCKEKARAHRVAL